MHAITCKEQQLVLHPSRAIYWEQQSALILSDLHFGKTGHFRKSGIPVPQNVYKEDLQRLISLIQFFRSRQVIIVGDLFHSHENLELDLFKRWRNDLPHTEVLLVKGNHDILHDDWYKKAAITTTHNELTLGPFTFRHDPAGTLPAGQQQYYFFGHVHPGISIHGAGRQSLHFPCFYFTEHYCILPAFSKFTGTYRVRPQKGEDVFAIVEERIMKL